METKDNLRDIKNRERNIESAELINRSSVFGPDLILNELDLVMNFSDPYHIESSILTLLTYLGFRQNDLGYKYSIFIISECVINMEVPSVLKLQYQKCAVTFNVTAASVEQNIKNAIKEAQKNGKLKRLNDLFEGEFIGTGNVGNSHLITCLCQRLIICRKYKKNFYHHRADIY